MTSRPDEYRQYLVADRSLGMSAGKLAAQVAHASVAFLLHSPDLDEDALARWVASGEAKIVLAVDGRSGLEALVSRAEAAGLEEDVDFFRILDECRTELTPDASGTCWTCVGFAPALASTMAPITGGLALYR
ncbi:MAG: peptidyl-tRNA hydrolase [Atopobiaceae bacterium]|jgi:PTH2 family peptidyl-tRNA hydrolase|nr:peptidyl-tRNA hydrolase [Atopobiaceae bacterium]MCI2174002.1 peptidyl-tRNA hydrolase [Atopobiaceae bacterium]MCI2207908.1 peptidyl-tRNA hydrolase [Atopobiaceae bacterium]